VVQRAAEGQLQRGARDDARVRRPVAVRAAPELRDDERAAQHARDRERLPDLRRGGRRARQPGRASPVCRRPRICQRSQRLKSAPAVCTTF